MTILLIVLLFIVGGVVAFFASRLFIWTVDSIVGISLAWLFMAVAVSTLSKQHLITEPQTIALLLGMLFGTLAYLSLGTSKPQRRARQRRHEERLRLRG